MKVIIAGSREIEDYDALLKTIQDADLDITEVVSGGCRGVDFMGEQWAQENAIPVRQFVADWAMYGRMAGELRNREMAQYADALILLWDGKSPGASCMLRESIQAGIHVHTQIHGENMKNLKATEQAILDHYWKNGGRLVYENDHWQWEKASEDAPEVNPHAVNALIRRGLMEAVEVILLKPVVDT